MGLSGRREKQRIPNDPRNLSWADNAAKFGQTYLSKLGWDPSKGLGVAGDGRTTHIKVSQKLDMLGVGAAQSKDPNGIAWKQNKDFEALLRRLNEGVEEETAVVSEGEAGMGEEGVLEVTDEGPEKADKKKRKRKDKDDSNEKKEKKKRKKEKDADDLSVMKLKPGEATPTPIIIEESSSSTTITVPTKSAVPRLRAHRARYIASKRLATHSASAISETLGIAPTPSASSSASPLPPKNTQMQGTMTQLDDTHTLEKLTTSTKSVADYFKDRLRTKASGSSTPLLSASDEKDDEAHEAPRVGLGSSRLGLGAKEDGQEPRMGIGASKFGSLMSSAFLASLPTASTIEGFVRPHANEGDSEPDGEDAGEETSGQLKEQPKKAEKKEKRKRDRKGKDKSVERPEPSDEDEDEKNSRRKAKKSKKGKRRGDGDDLDLEPAQTNDGGEETKKRDKEARKKEKAERKRAKKATR